VYLKNFSKAWASQGLFLLLTFILVHLSACQLPQDWQPGLASTKAPSGIPATLPSPSLEPSLTSLPPTATPLPSSTPTPPPTATPIPPSPTPESLILWTSEQEQALATIRALVEEYNGQAPLKVQVLNRKADTLRTDLLAAKLAGANLPDLIWGNQNDLAGLLFDEQLQPLNLPEGTTGFLSAALTGATFNGQLWGLPLTVQDFLFLYFNRALVSTPPQTTDELIVTSRAEREGQPNGLVAAWFEARWLLAWLNGFGGLPTSPDGLQPTLDTPQMVQALNLLHELYLAAPPETQTLAEGRNLFASGKVAMALDGDWARQSYLSFSPTIQVGIAPLPLAVSTGRLAGSAVGGSYLLYQRNIPQGKQAAVVNFTQYLASPAIQLRLAQALGRLPALRAALASPQLAGDPSLTAAVAQAESSIGLPPTKGLRCALAGINAHLPAFLTSSLDAQNTATAMQETAANCLAK